MMNTNDLQILLNSDRSTEELVKEAHEITYKAYMQYLMNKYDVQANTIVRLSGLAKRSAYKVINGENKKPSKDRIYRVALSIGVSVEECDILFCLANAGGFFLQNPRDIILARGLIEKKNVIDVDIQLEAFGYKVLEGGIK